jgi:hypothetical protein
VVEAAIILSSDSDFVRSNELNNWDRGSVDDVLLQRWRDIVCLCSATDQNFSVLHSVRRIVGTAAQLDSTGKLLDECCLRKFIADDVSKVLSRPPPLLPFASIEYLEQHDTSMCFLALPGKDLQVAEFFQIICSLDSLSFIGNEECPCSFTARFWGPQSSTLKIWCASEVVKKLQIIERVTSSDFSVMTKKLVHIASLFSDIKIESPLLGLYLEVLASICG